MRPRTTSTRATSLYGTSQRRGYVAVIDDTTKDVRQFSIGDTLGQPSDVRAAVDQFGPSDLSKKQHSTSRSSRTPEIKVSTNTIAQ
jgi:predicted component of type VI protein secretion system